MKNYLLIGALLLLSALNSCKDGSDEKPVVKIDKNKGLFIVNEGTFNFGNATLSYINLEDSSKSSIDNIFKSANNRPLGDVFQSILFVNGQAWLILNGSQKIEIIDPETGVSKGSIKGLVSPRYGLEVSPEKIYITDLYSNEISVINPNTLSLSNKIKCPGWTEELILHNGKVWVCNHNSEYLYIIDPIEDKITDSVHVSYGGSSILVDKADDIWVLCSGDFLKKKTGGLYGIHSDNKTIFKEHTFNTSDYNPIKLKQNPEQDSLFFIFNGVYAFSKNATSIPNTPFINQNNGSSFYGLGIHPISGAYYVADAADFTSKGKVFKYSRKGLLEQTYSVGVAPSEFAFW